MKHTELPWASHKTIVHLSTLGGFDIKNCPDAEANAAFIVKACNNHENLIEVIRGALRISDLWAPEPDSVDEGHIGEAEALHAMRRFFIQAIKEAE